MFARNDLLFTMSDNTHTERAPMEGAASQMRISLRMSRQAHSRTSLLLSGSPTGGARRDRTDDLLLAKQALSQLSYGPFAGGRLVGLGRFELPTSRLSSARSNQLSYRPRARATPAQSKRTQGQRMLQTISGRAWARPRRKRNVDGEVLPMDSPILKLTKS